MTNSSRPESSGHRSSTQKSLPQVSKKELSKGKAKIKNMATGEEIEVDLDIGKIKEVLLNK